jgi:hypothetical protein
MIQLSACKNDKVELPEPEIHSSGKINGVSFTAPSNVIDSNSFVPIKNVGAKWICLIPFGFASQGNPTLQYNLPQQYWGERKDGLIECTRLAREQHQSIMLKPQIWITDGSYTGEYGFQNESNWQSWETQYRNFILFYAHLADSLQLEMLCIGTELKTFVANRQTYWETLIDSIKTIYHGKLTYASNWDDYNQFPHWRKLDYIGVDSYFPLSSSTTPGVDELRNAWNQTFNSMKSFSMDIGKPVLFTEYGYRSINACAQMPWESGNSTAINLQGQANAYEAFYKKFYPECWFAGGFIWKWYDDPSAGGSNDDDFTPQNKPAQEIIHTYFTKP